MTSLPLDSFRRKKLSHLHGITFIQFQLGHVVLDDAEQSGSVILPAVIAPAEFLFRRRPAAREESTLGGAAVAVAAAVDVASSSR